MRNLSARATVSESRGGGGQDGSGAAAEALGLVEVQIMGRTAIYSHTEAVERRREQNRDWFHKRRARGVCHNPHCENSPDINPKTGEPYWSCRSCRRLGK
jgi:hypothetical protein